MSSGETDVEVDQILDLSSMNNIVSDHDDVDQNNIPVPIIAFGETKIKSPVQEVSTAGKSSLWLRFLGYQLITFWSVPNNLRLYL